MAVCLDVVALTLRGDELCVAVSKRGEAPLKGRLQVPNLPLPHADQLSQAASDVVTQQIGCAADDVSLKTLAVRGAARRDPRGPTLDIAWWTTLPPSIAQASPLSLLPVRQAPGARLAFAQADLVREAVDRLARDLRFTTAAVRLCEETFTMAQLRRVYEVVWGVELDPANFHRKVSGSHGFVEPTAHLSQGGPGRPARYYRAGPADDLVSAIAHPDMP